MLTLQAWGAHVYEDCRRPQAAASTGRHGPVWVLAGRWSRGGPCGLWHRQLELVRRTPGDQQLSAQRTQVAGGVGHRSELSCVLGQETRSLPHHLRGHSHPNWPSAHSLSGPNTASVGLGDTPLPLCPAEHPALAGPAPEQMSKCPPCHRLLPRAPGLGSLGFAPGAAAGGACRAAYSSACLGALLTFRGKEPSQLGVRIGEGHERSLEIKPR